MIQFIQESTLIVKLLYIITIFLSGLYIYKKIRNRKYIFSIFNIGVYIFLFTVIFIGPFQYADSAWNALGYHESSMFYKYLNKEMIISLVGLIVFLSVLIYMEFRDEDFIKLDNCISNLSLNINEKSVLLINIIVVIVWYGLIGITIKSLPVFGHRTFAESFGVQPIYIALNTCISIFLIYYGFKYVISKKPLYILPIVVNGFTSFATGNRGPLLMGILSIVIIYMYIKCQDSLKINAFILVAGIAVLVLGMGMSVIRDGGHINNFGKIFNDIVYANTFSDVRDGSYVLYGFEQKYDTFLYGKNYLADLISFIPSSMSDFRSTWSYGAFSANTLFGWEGHYGLRGGWFLQPYINFGYIGVIASSILYGLVIAYLENFFYKNIIRKEYDSKIISNKLIITNTLCTVSSFILVSSAGAQYYISVILIISLILVSIRFNIRNYKKYKSR
ncbi:O-antigen polymerase [Paraclostridium bifermentans]|uniref:O-antigen polymerase n=1 Tax=Paraclostridium bifermentans TaxID=1490 RepID=UPI0022DF3A7F|nr:O-antigen ligase [Paraclostridium bifermentans]